MKQRIAIGVLDWGLGHATRMVPVAEALRTVGAEVVWLTSGRSGLWLRNRYPLDEHHSLPGARIRYGKSAFWSVVRMMPALYRAEKQEHRWLAANIPVLGLSGLISDNRYGLHARGLPSVLVTHQLAPLPPNGFGGLKSLIARLMADKLHRFDQVWVPDIPGPDSLAGVLIVNQFFQGRMHHIGWLSRFEGLQPLLDRGLEYHQLGLASGPEVLGQEYANELLTRFQKTGFPSLILCGRPDRSFDNMSENVRMAHHMDDISMASAMMQAGQIVCRAGYSTLMDLRTLGLTAELSATPGQTEQVYLAERHRGLPKNAPMENTLLKQVLREWLRTIPHQ